MRGIRKPSRKMEMGLAKAGIESHLWATKADDVAVIGPNDSMFVADRGPVPLMGGT